jgi:hypothetical protein
VAYLATVIVELLGRVPRPGRFGQVALAR